MAETAKNRVRRLDRRDKGLCVDCGDSVEGCKLHCAIHREYHYEKSRQTHGRRKRAVFEAYGGCQCRCCGEHRVHLLSIDHINNDGAAHRRAVGSGVHLYAWLKRNKYPPGFQVLCYNCNLAKGLSHECPHVAERRNKVFYTGIHNDSPVNVGTE